MALTDPKVKQAKPKSKDYKLADEKGLFLLVKTSGAKYWRFKYRFAGKEKLLAVGVYPDVGIKKARELRDTARKQLADGIDPADIRRIEKTTIKQLAENSFETIAREWHSKQKTKWTDAYAAKKLRNMELYLFPYIGHRPVASITAPELLMVLRKTESRGIVETAHRLKQTTGQVFRYSIITGRAERDPSADLRDALAPTKTKHLAAITDPKVVSRLLIAIDGFQGTPSVKAALSLSPLLFCRPGELRQMEWKEIDWDEKLWEIPGEKMKMGQPHIVPLCKQAIAILQEQQLLTGNGRYVFPSARGRSRPLSDNAVRTALRTLGYDNETMTPHGFRAMARTILDEVLGYRVDWIEHQLAHAVKDSNGRAYNRTSHLPQRKQMMQRWADYLDQLKTMNDKVTILKRA
jgi:integrase